MPYHRRRRSRSASSAYSRGSSTPPPAYSRSNARPRRSSPARRPAAPAPSRRPDPRSSAPRPPMPPPASSRRRHQSSSRPSQNRSPPLANPRSRTSRNRTGGSRVPATPSSRRRSPSPDDDTLGPWDAISRDGTPPPGHPNRDRDRHIRVTTAIGAIDFSCDEARTAEEHRKQLADAEGLKRIVVGHGERYIRALQGSSESLEDALENYTRWLVQLAGMELHVACLKRSQRGDSGVWGHLREISDDPDNREGVIED